MTDIYEIPLRPGVAQELSVAMGGMQRTLRLVYADAPEAGWLLDIANADTGERVVCGIPLTTGGDLLAPYSYLELGCGLYVSTAGDAERAPTFTDLGDATKLYLAVEG